MAESVLVLMAHAGGGVALDQGSLREAGLMAITTFARIAELTENTRRRE